MATYVKISNPYEKVGFIIYNHIYAREKDTFTLEELSLELTKYGLFLDWRDLMDELCELADEGVILFRGYGSGRYFIVNHNNDSF